MTAAAAAHRSRLVTQSPAFLGLQQQCIIMFANKNGTRGGQAEVAVVCQHGFHAKN